MPRRRVAANAGQGLEFTRTVVHDRMHAHACHVGTRAPSVRFRQGEAASSGAPCHALDQARRQRRLCARVPTGTSHLILLAAVLYGMISRFQKHPETLIKAAPLIWVVADRGS